MQSVEYQKIDLKDYQDIPFEINLDFLIEEFSMWIVEYMNQQSPLIIEGLIDLIGFNN